MVRRSTLPKFYTPYELKRRVRCLENECIADLVARGVRRAEARRHAKRMIQVLDVIETDDQGRIRYAGIDLSKY